MFGFDRYTKSCLDTHMGLWCVDDLWANAFLHQLQTGWLQTTLREQGPIAPVTAKSEAGYDLYGSTAIVPLVGSISPRGSKWGGASTLEFRRGIRAAARDPSVETILAYINSPGGVVEGTREAADDFRRVGETKRTRTHFQDMGTSGAYYVGSQAHEITANESAWLGNIGVRSAIVDSSQLYELQGVKVHLLSTGPFKAIGVPGTAVTPEQIEHVQSLIQQTFELFAESVSTGRNLTGERLEDVLTGKTYMAKEAMQIGLIDAITDVESSVSYQGDVTMAESESPQQGMWSSIGSMLSSGKLKIVPSVEPEQGMQVTDQTVVPATSQADLDAEYERGMRDGIAAARKESAQILSLYMIAGSKDGLARAYEAISQCQSAQEVQKELTTERALRSNEDGSGQSVELNTTAPTHKPPVTLRPVAEVNAERDQMARAASYEGIRS